MKKTFFPAIPILALGFFVVTIISCSTKGSNSSLNKSTHMEIIGHKFNFQFGENAVYQLRFLDAKHLDVTVVKDPNYATGTLNHFEIQMTEVRSNVYMVTWVEPDTKNTVTHLEDFENNIAYTNITDVASKQFYNLKGTIERID
ncbi:MAG: MoaF N-terminal domain-containing protein [Bacteroidota bacterium]